MPTVFNDLIEIAVNPVHPWNAFLSPQVLTVLTFPNLTDVKLVSPAAKYSIEFCPIVVTLLKSIEVALLFLKKLAMQKEPLALVNELQSTALTPAQLAGYRRVYVSASDNTAFNGSITDADGKDIAAVENGVVKNSADKWIGFTQTDNGGFFRIPADQDISIRLNTVRSAAVSVGIGEYELYDAKTTMLFDQSVNARATDTVIISLPAVSQNEMPSDTAYSVTVIPGGEGSNILGDADMNGTVDMIDATWIQRHSAGLITLSEDALALCDVDKDESVTIMDVTAIQRCISMLKAPEGIGEPIA